VKTAEDHQGNTDQGKQSIRVQTCIHVNVRAGFADVRRCEVIQSLQDSSTLARISKLGFE
jgi:hypothetical protein